MAALFLSRLSRTLRSLPRTALDLLYPPRCAACVARLPALPASDFCPSCEDLLEPVIAPACEICSEPFPGQIPHAFACPNCADQTFAFECAISVWHSSGPLREAIHRFKYARSIHLRLPLARKLFDTLSDPRLAEAAPSDKSPDPSDAFPEWLLVPVPLHARRLRERRFNQSAELARTLSKLSGLPCQDLLRRTRYTTAQAALSRKERLKNLAGAFSLKPKAALPAHGNLLLIDDVFTTGSTAHECATVLKKAGAQRIIVLTVARG
jgi:competence protein ComFC